MQPVNATYSTIATQIPISLDWRVVPFSVSYAVVYNGSTGSMTLDHTYDNVNDPTITPTWFSSAAITSNGEGTLTTPVQFVRANITALTGGTLTLKILQGESIN